MVNIDVATRTNVAGLSDKVLRLLSDREGQFYQDNVTKFGIPDGYVLEAFSRETLLKAFDSGEATFYLAFEGREIIGFAQVITKSADMVELDRIVVFSGHARRGIGTVLLRYVIGDQQRKGVRALVVNTGKQEAAARAFYEKNGFQLTKEWTLDAPWGKTLQLVSYQLRID